MNNGGKGKLTIDLFVTSVTFLSLLQPLRFFDKTLRVSDVHFQGVQKCQIRNKPASNGMFKVNNRNTRTRCEICSKLTIKIPE